MQKIIPVSLHQENDRDLIEFYENSVNTGNASRVIREALRIYILVTKVLRTNVYTEIIEALAGIELTTAALVSSIKRLESRLGELKALLISGEDKQ